MLQQQPFISELWLHSVFMDKNKPPLNYLQSVEELKKKVIIFKWIPKQVSLKGNSNAKLV